MKSQHSADIIPHLKHHRLTKGAEDYGNSLDNYAGFIVPHISERGLNNYNWLEFVIFEDLPLSFVDHPMVQSIASSTMLRVYVLRVGYLVSLKVDQKSK